MAMEYGSSPVEHAGGARLQIRNHRLGEEIEMALLLKKRDFAAGIIAGVFSQVLTIL
jgi:hypothetical protein